MSLDLRPYQIQTYDETRAAIQDCNAVLIQSPTGSGKTVLIAKMLQHASQRGYPCWFLVHRRELIEQSVITLTESAGLSLGIVAAGFPGNRHELIQVCSVQTLANRRHLLQAPKLIVYDEAHHVAASTWSTIFSAYTDAVHIGLTATPERLDGTGLDGFFKKLVLGPSVKKLIDDGWLSKYRLYAPSAPDLSGVHTIAGDYNKKELAVAMSESAVVGDALAHYRKHAMGLRSVIFMWSVEASEKIAEQFRAAGIAAAHVGGDTDKATRDRTIQDFRSGQLKVLSNVEIISEGFDLPGIEAVFLLRPTRSLAMYLQQVGRALRPFPGKEEALIFDHAGNAFKRDAKGNLETNHGLPDDERVWTLEGRRRKKAEASECPVKQCPKCYAMIVASSMLCKWCGFAFQVQSRNIDQVDGELSEVDLEAQREKARQEVREAKTPDDLLFLGMKRGYKNPEKWAAHILKWRGQKHEAFTERQKQIQEEARAKVQYATSGETPKDWI